MKDLEFEKFWVNLRLKSRVAEFFSFLFYPWAVLTKEERCVSDKIGISHREYRMAKARTTMGQLVSKIERFFRYIHRLMYRIKLKVKERIFGKDGSEPWVT